jgi:glycine reductase
MHRHTWRLEVGTFPVQRLALASRTAYEHDTLFINEAELQARIAEPGAIADVAVHLAHPGESCRIVHVLDAVSPMIKVAGPSTVYPGFFGNALPAGSGRTHVLGGAAVLVSSTFPEPASGALSAAEAAVDMSGPAAACCAFSDTANVVLVCRPASGASNADFDAALQRAKLKAAVYLAEATAGLESPQTDVYELKPVDAALPRVVFLDQLHQQGLLAQTFLYGRHTQGLEPTLLHPNEMLDGALVSGNYRQPGRSITCGHSCNDVVRELYRRHGHDLNFLGVVIGRGWQDTQALKERHGWMMARLAGLLGAQAAVVSADVGGTGGNNTIDFMQTIKACEQMGIRTVAIMQEAGNADGSNPTLVDHVPEADAIVSVGGVGWDIPLAPAVSRVIGGATVQPNRAQDPLDAAGPLQVACWYGAVWKRTVRGLSAVDA